jgi:hypothetical protein
MLLGDMNGDSLLDVIVANTNDHDISVLLGNGDGTLQIEQRFPVGGVPNSISLADLNRDGFLDISTGLGSDGISVLYGQGDGTFQEYQITVQTQAGAGSLFVDDFNGDGLFDFVFSSNRSVSVRFGNSAGGYSKQQQVNAGGQIVEMADLNGDGWADAIVLNTNELFVLFGNGDGSFQASSHTYSIDRLIDVVDMDGDGRLDLVAVVNGRLSTLLGTDAGDFEAPVQSGSTFSCHQILLGDMNGDGIFDAACVKQGGYFDEVGLLSGQPNGTFEEQQSHQTMGIAYMLGLSDISGDGMLDAVFTDSHFDLQVLLGSIDNGSQGPVFWGGVDLFSRFIFGDLNGDGRTDLVIDEYVRGAGYSEIITRLAPDYSTEADLIGSNGAATLESIKLHGSLDLGDLDQDGNLDLVAGTACNENGYIPTAMIRLGNGNGSFQPKRYIDLGFCSPEQLKLIDLNGDELLDLLVFFHDPSYISVALGNGDGTFQRHKNFQIDHNVGSLFLTDVNGDERLDIVFSHGDNFTVMLNRSSILAFP